MAVLKCDGNLIINSGVTLTTPTYSSSCNGVTGNVTNIKGLFICCTGTLINNGTISQTARGTYTNDSSNVLLWKNSNGSYETVSGTGASGGASASIYTTKNETSYASGNAGTNASGRQTGGGGSGGVCVWGNTNKAVSGQGGYGNAYRGGSGSGGVVRRGGGTATCTGSNVESSAIGGNAKYSIASGKATWYMSGGTRLYWWYRNRI